MTVHSTATPSSSLTAPPGAQGGAVAGRTEAGWAAVLWVAQMVLSLDIAMPDGHPWALVWALMKRILRGDFTLQGCEVSQWTIRNGRDEIACLRIRVRGDGGEFSGKGSFSLTVEIYDAVSPEFDVVEPVRLIERRGEVIYRLCHAKIQIGCTSLHAHIVPLP